MIEAQVHAREVRERLRRPPNAVPDRPIKLKGRFAQPKEPVVMVTIVDNSPEPQPIEVSRDWLLVDSVNYRREKVPPHFDRHIKETVAVAFGVSIEDINSERRQMLFVLARHASIVFCDQFTLLSMAEIARRHCRDHTVGIYAKRELPGRMCADAWLCQTIVELENQFKQEVAKWRAAR